MCQKFYKGGKVAVRGRQSFILKRVGSSFALSVRAEAENTTTDADDQPND